jgi:hypothetical protein
MKFPCESPAGAVSHNLIWPGAQSSPIEDAHVEEPWQFCSSPSRSSKLIIGTKIQPIATPPRPPPKKRPHTIILELVEHIPRVPWCIASATDGFYSGEIRSIEHALHSRVQACAVVSIGVATMDNKKALFVTLVDHVSRFEAYGSQFFEKFD